MLLKITLKVLAVQGGIKRIDLRGRELSLKFSEAHQKNPFGIVDMITEDSGRFQFTPDHVLKARLEKKNVKKSIVLVKNILKEITRRVNT